MNVRRFIARTIAPAIHPIGSAFLRSHGVEISEHGLNRLAIAFRTRRVGLLVLGDMLLTLEDRAAIVASKFIGRHGTYLHFPVHASRFYRLRALFHAWSRPLPCWVTFMPPFLHCCFHE